MKVPLDSAAPGGPGGPGRGLARWASWPLLALLALLYGALGAARRWAYRHGWLRVERAACPVLSVGNLSAGGSGKTPLVDWLLRAAQRQGRRPVAISRGYRGRSEADVMRVRAAEGLAPDAVALGDEPALLALRNPQVPVYAARRRVLAARLAAVRDRPDLIVLDDGFQHLRLARELDVVLIDAAEGLGNGHLLPLGPLREPLRAARRAHAVLLTKAAPGSADALRRHIADALGAVPVFTCDYRPVCLRRLDGGARQAVESLRGRTVRLMCGIARPQAFVRTVQALGARVAGLQAHADHFAYPEAALHALEAALATEQGGEDGPGDGGGSEGREGGAPLWLTTDKDAVKLTGRLTAPERLWVLEMEAVPDPEAQAFFFDFIARTALH